MTFGEYQVTGKREYRGHKPGEVFEAALESGAEARAIARGDIRLLRTVTLRVPDGAIPPDRWLPIEIHHEPTEAPEGASSIEGGGG